MVRHRMLCVFLAVAFSATIIFQNTFDKESYTSKTMSYVMGTTAILIGAGLVYRRHCQVDNLLQFAGNASVVRLVNKAAMLSAIIVLVCFLLFKSFSMFEANNVCSTIGDILVYGFGTLYIWMQCVLTSYLSPLYYGKHLTLLRVVLSCLSFVVLVAIVLSGLVANVTRGVNSQADSSVSVQINMYCHHVAAAIFCLFLMSFDRDHKHLNVILQTDLLDDNISTSSTSYPEYSSTYGPIQILTQTSNTLRRNLAPLLT